jgi:hypothetical protein
MAFSLDSRLATDKVLHGGFAFGDVCVEPWYGRNVGRQAGRRTGKDEGCVLSSTNLDSKPDVSFSSPGGRAPYSGKERHLRYG